MPYVLGIDLGTTYTAAATYRDGRAQIVSIGTHTAAVPSVVFLRQDENVLTGEAADRRALTEPARVTREFKRRVGDTTPIMVGGTPYSAEQLSAELLKAVIAQVEQLEGGRADHVAVCHPTNWGPYKKELLVQTVELADVRDPTFVTEPEAAAVHYASTEHVAPGDIVAVYDLGGGTFDAAVLRKTETGFETLGEPQGIERLGGIDFDAAVFAHVRNAVGGALDELDENDPTVIAAAARLREECIDAKEALSSDSETAIPVLLPNVMTEVRLTRGEFEAMIRPSLTQTIGALERALRSADVGAEDISRVLLVGGSSRIPLVAEMVGAALGRPVATDAHPKHAIALGAAIAGAAAVADVTTAELAAATAVVATPEPAAVSRTLTIGGAAAAAEVAAGGAAGWQADPTGRHEYRYFDGSAWTDNVSDQGTTSTDPMDVPSAPADTAGPAPLTGSRKRRSKVPVIAGAAAVVVLIVAALVLRGGGGGGGGDGTGQFSAQVASGKVFVHQVKVPEDSVLLVKVIPNGQFDPLLALAADGPTVEKYRTSFGGPGALDTSSIDAFSDVDVSSEPGKIFAFVNDVGPGQPEVLAQGSPFEATVDVVVGGVGGTSGSFTLQTAVRTFVGPPTESDTGFAYTEMVRAAYKNFLDGTADISDTKEFGGRSDFTDNTDFTAFSSDFSDVPR